MTNPATVYIGLGSNLDNPMLQIRQALEAIAQIPHSDGLECAPWFRSKAIGPGEQPDYINTAARLHTELSPLEFLGELQAIENNQGRQRKIRWGARTLDLDLLLYDQLQHRCDNLQLPHPEMHQRAFVLLPLAHLEPKLTLPNGAAINDYLAQCDTSELKMIEPITTSAGSY